MIIFDKKIKIYSYELQNVFCCDCFFETVARLLLGNKEFESCDEFIKILEKKFPRENFTLFTFSGTVLLTCKNTLKFLIKAKKNNEVIMKRSCLLDFVENGENPIKFCLVCLLKIFHSNKYLEQFKVKDEKDAVEYLYL